MQIDRVVSHIAAILAEVAPLFTNFFAIAVAASLTQLALVLLDVPHVMPNVPLVGDNVAPIMSDIASVLAQVTLLPRALAQLAFLLHRQRLRCRCTCLRRGLSGGTRAGKHNERDGHHS
jgi:hypothetical protein